MKANELRIGNLVFHPMVDTVFEIARDDFEYHRGFSNIEHYRPIPLTEEWLLKFGFEKDFNSYWCIPNKYFELLYNKVIGYRLSIEGQYAYTEIKYVHQLQNLYFALTGQEL